MRLGLNVGYWGLGMGAADQLELVKEAEAAGFDSVWAAEAYGSDAATVLAWLAAQTERIRIGSSIFQMPGRSPAMTAMTAATLDQLSGGRMLLGIGTSGPQVAEGWHGQRFGKQLQRTREYVEILRKALARERLEYDGETYQLPLPDGPGQGAEADDRAGAGADPDLHRRRSGRRTRSSPARSPTAGCRSSSPPSTWTGRASCSRRAPRAPAGRSGRSSTSRRA